MTTISSCLSMTIFSVFEKLTGSPEGKKANIMTTEKMVIDKQLEIDDHNLKKLRTAMNMITATISDAESQNDKEKMKEWHNLVTKKFKLLEIDDKTAPKAMVSRKKAVEAGLEICNEIYDPTNDRLTEREKHLKGGDAMMKYQMATKVCKTGGK